MASLRLVLSHGEEMRNLSSSGCLCMESTLGCSRLRSWLGETQVLSLLKTPRTTEASDEGRLAYLAQQTSVRQTLSEAVGESLLVDVS